MKKENSHTLKELQKYIKKTCEENGWDRASLIEKYLLLSEEIGELAKAIREKEELYSEIKKEKALKSIGEELADILSYILDIANQCGIDLEKSFWEKEKINKKRKWSKK